MEIEISDNDSNGSEVFVLKQIKPVFANSSKLIQSTLEGTPVKKGSDNSKKNEKSNKRSREKKHRSDSNKTKSKKIKSGVPESSPIKKLGNNNKSIGVSQSYTQSTGSDEIIVVDKVKKANVKNVQKQILSYFFKKNVDVKFEETRDTEKVKLASSLKITTEQEMCRKINIGNNEVLLEKNSNTNDDIEPLIIEEKVKDPMNTTEAKNDPVEQTVETSDINFIEPLDFAEDFTPNEELNIEEFHSVEELQNNLFFDESKVPGKEKYIDHSELLCSHAKKIIREELEKQTFLENQCLKNGKIIEKLILDHESKIMEKFFNLNENACKVFIRMLGRKRSWHRLSTINYPGISNNLNTEFGILHKEGFIDINIEDENLSTQMELLNRSEVLDLCKAFNVPVKSNSCNSCRKETLISCLISNSEKQKSALDMFKVKNSTTRLNMLKSKVKTCLGLCIKLNNTVFEVFYKFLLLFSFAHYQDEESKRFSNELLLWLQVLKNNIKFPNYEVHPTVVFETLKDFEEFKNSLLVQERFETAIVDKNFDEFISAYDTAKIEFKKLLENNEYCERFSSLKPFLRKFSAGTVYARILTKYCKTFKKQSSNSEILSTVHLLMGQKIFLTGKKGEWYEILSKALENQKQNNAAAEVIIESLKDPAIDEVQKLTLQIRGQSILKKKTNGINDSQLRDVLESLCASSVQEPISVEIRGRALESNEAGFKTVYVQELEHGTVYASVEERALSYYKSKGFPKGHHSEGFIIHTIYFLLFFDIIYGLSPEGVFQSPYQKAPLDFSSGSFFHNRKEEIEALINDMLSWDDEQIEAQIRNSYYKNYNTACVITWNENFTPEVFCEIIKCITMPILVAIFHRLVRNYRVFRSGFPDLTLWNPETNVCKFVEVKSPKDKLSPAQRIWLDFLRNIGLDCEVCNVKNFSGKSFD